MGKTFSTIFADYKYYNCEYLSVRYLLSLTPTNAEKLENYLTQNNLDMDMFFNDFIHKTC